MDEGSDEENEEDDEENEEHADNEDVDEGEDAVDTNPIEEPKTQQSYGSDHSVQVSADAMSGISSKFSGSNVSGGVRGSMRSGLGAQQEDMVV